MTTSTTTTTTGVKKAVSPKKRRRRLGVMLWQCVRWVCCFLCWGWNRRVEVDEEDDGDVEMGGGRSLLVSERVRMLQEPKKPTQKKEATSPRSGGATIAERRAMFDDARRSEKGRTSQDEVDSEPLLKRTSSQQEAVARLRRQQTKKSCVVCGCDVFPRDEVVKGGATYHGGCLRCASCGRSLLDVPFGRIAEADDLLYCDETAVSRSGRSCLAKAREIDWEDVAKEDKNQRPSDADVARIGRAKINAVDLIGDDLDKIVRGMAPTCAVCGGTFAASDPIVMQGMVKYHESCCYYGGPTADAKEVPLDPVRALEDAPGTLLIKVATSRDGKPKVMTFFAQRRQDDDKNKMAPVLYDADATSRAPKRRKCLREGLRTAKVRVLGTTGNAVTPETTGAFEDDLSSCFLASFDWTANALDWSLVCDFDFLDDTLAFQKATLNVVKSKSSQGGKTQQPPR